jgi:hypothetical protein
MFSAGLESELLDGPAFCFRIMASPRIVPQRSVAIVQIRR